MSVFDPAALRAAVMQKLTSAQNDRAEAGNEEAVEPEHSVGMAPYAALVGGSLADGVTTDRALSSGRGQEGNPLMLGKGRASVAAQKALTTAVLAWAMREVGKKHPNIAKVMGYGMGGAMGAVAARNAQVGK